MSRRMITILGATAALFAASAPAASAADAAGLPYCWGAKYGTTTEIAVCAAENSTFGNGTVDPAASTDCIIKVPVAAAIATDIRPVVISPCKLTGQLVTGIGQSGFSPSGQPINTPYFSGLSVRHDGQFVGTLWVDDIATRVALESSCVGACSQLEVAGLVLSAK